MTESHTIMMIVLLIAITSVGVVRCKRADIRLNLEQFHTKGKNGKPEWILSGGWDLRNIRSSYPTFNARLKDILGIHRSTDWDREIYRYTYTLKSTKETLGIHFYDREEAK